MGLQIVAYPHSLGKIGLLRVPVASESFNTGFEVGPILEVGCTPYRSLAYPRSRYKFTLSKFGRKVDRQQASPSARTRLTVFVLMSLVSCRSPFREYADRHGSFR